MAENLAPYGGITRIRLRGLQHFSSKVVDSQP